MQILTKLNVRSRDGHGVQTILNLSSRMRDLSNDETPVLLRRCSNLPELVEPRALGSKFRSDDHIRKSIQSIKLNVNISGHDDAPIVLALAPTIS